MKTVANMIVLSFMIYISLFVGYNVGYYQGTGTMPFGPKSESVTPPELEASTSEEVEEFVVLDETELEKYDVGFNCVEFALLQARNAHWKGIPATVVRIDFESGASHWILGFPTVDAGWKFFEPQMNDWIYPRVGGMFTDKKIVGVYYLYDFVWRPIEVAVKPSAIGDSTPVATFPEFGSTKEFRFFEGSSEKYTVKEQFKYEDDRGLKELRNPTYSEALQFMKDMIYFGDKLTCTDYCWQTREVANNKGLRCAAVCLFFGTTENVGNSHVIVAFETTDKGLVHFEPQTNEERRVECRGQSYPYEDSADKLLFVVYLW